MFSLAAVSFLTLKIETLFENSRTICCCFLLFGKMALVAVNAGTYQRWRQDAAVEMESALWGGIYTYCVCCGKWDLGSHDGSNHRRKLATWKDDSEHNRIVWSVDYTKGERYGRETLSRILMEYEDTASIFAQVCQKRDAREGAGAGAPPPPPPTSRRWSTSSAGAASSTRSAPPGLASSGLAGDAVAGLSAIRSSLNEEVQGLQHRLDQLEQNDEVEALRCRMSAVEADVASLMERVEWLEGRA